MITYVYDCENCDVGEFEVSQSIKDKPKKKCPKCGKHKLFRVIQPVSISVKLATSEIRTLGHLANRNRDTFSNDYMGHLNRKNKTKKLPPKELPRGMTRVEVDKSPSPLLED